MVAFGKAVAHRRFALPLGPGIGRRAIRIRADRRDMDERVRTGLARGLRHGARAVDMDRLHLAAHHADQIDDRIGPLDRARHRVRPGDVGRHELGLAQSALRAQEIGLARIALRHPDARARLHQFACDIAAQKAPAADQRHQLVRHDRPYSPDFLCTAPLPRKKAVDKDSNPTLKAQAYPVPRWRNW